MTLKKRILKSRVVHALAILLGRLYIRFVYYTSRWTHHGIEIPEQYWNSGKPFILCLWHGRLLMMPCCWRKKHQMNMLISGHRDGLLIASIVKSFRINPIVGSKSKGGAAALRQILKTIKGGEWVGVTPDGPRGPYMSVSDGTIQMALLSGADLIPVSYSTTRAKILRSWDRFHLALPFSKGVFVWGDPISVTQKEDLEKDKIALQNRLVELTETADQMCRRTTPEIIIKNKAEQPKTNT